MARSKRRRRKGEVVCWCTAYDFPHRFSGGRCNGISLVRDALNGGHPYCFSCHLYQPGETEPPCQVLLGQESPKECPVVQEFAAYHEVKLH